MNELNNKTIKEAIVKEKSFNGEEVFDLYLKMTDGTIFLIEDFENINLLIEKEKCTHIYSRIMNQDYPRKCTLCGEVEK